MRVVLDTNVLYAAILSNKGASYHLLSLLPDSRFKTVVTTTLLAEYEDVLFRPDTKITVSAAGRTDILDFLCLVFVRQKVHYLWRPWLRDPKDDMVVEAALAGSATFIVTHNLRDFAGVESLGIRAVSPPEFLAYLGE